MTRSSILLLLLSVSRGGAQAPVAMHEEPRHRLVLAHRHVRVMDVRILPGDTTRFHVHDLPAIYVAVSVAPVDIQLFGGQWGGTQPDADPGRGPGDVSVDTLYPRQPVTHRVTNVGSRLFNLIAITSATGSPDDPGPSDLPGELELRNRWFTQSRVRLPAGEASRWYPAPAPTILVKPLAGSATVVLESGGKQDLTAPGSWALVPAGMRYRLTVATATTLVVIQVK